MNNRREHTDAKLKIVGVDKTFKTTSGREFSALKNIFIEIASYEFVSVIGPSGCGKTTLLRMIAGLEFPTAGQILLDDLPITGPGRDRGVVFQEDAIFLWRRVIENVEFGLEMRGIAKTERRKIAQRYLNMVHLEDFAAFYPKELSGGMKKRVALAAVFANSPEVLLMDEPFGALDYQSKSELQMELLDIWQQESKTTVFVTHDIEEALILADRIVVLSKEGTLKKMYKVPFSRPRTEDLRYSPEFTAVRGELAKLFGDSNETKEATV